MPISDKNGSVLQAVFVGAASVHTGLTSFNAVVTLPIAFMSCFINDS